MRFLVRLQCALLLSGVIAQGPGVEGAEYFSDDFENYFTDEDLTVVGGWRIEETNTPIENAAWTVTNPGGRGHPPGRDGIPSEGQFVSSDSDAAGGDDLPGSGMSHDLWSPSFNCAGATRVWLHFDCTAQMNNNGLCVFDVDVSTNGGTDWVNVFRTVAPSRAVPPQATTANAGGYFGRLDIDLTGPAAGKSDVKVRWRHFEPNDDWWIAVDNVLVDDEPAPSAVVNLVSERFDNGIPNTWTIRSVIDPPNTGGNSWSTLDPCLRSALKYNAGLLPYKGGRGIHRLDAGYALSDSECDPAPVGTDEYLLTPVVNCSQATRVVFSYKSEICLSSGSIQEVLLSLDGGASFESPAIFNYNAGAGFDNTEEPFFGQYAFDVPAAIGKTEVVFAFHHAGPATEEDQFWAIDDVKVSADGAGLPIRNCLNREFVVSAFDPGTRSVTMNWRSLAGDQGVRVLANGTQIGADLPAGVTTYTDVAPPAGGSVTYSLQSLSGGAAEFECTAPPVSVILCPGDFACCVNQTTKAITLSWANGVNLAGTGYRILRNNLPRTTVSLDTSSFVDTTVPGPGVYEYTLVLNGGSPAQCPQLPLQCTAVVLGADLFFYDDFDCYLTDAQLEAAGWDIVEDGAPVENAAWTIKDPGGRGAPPGADGKPTGGKFVVSDSDAAGGDDGQGTLRSHDLWTPRFNCTGATSVWLHAACSLVMNNNGVVVFDVDVTTNDGATWENVFRRVAPARGVEPLPLADIPEGFENGPQMGNADGFFGTLHVDIGNFAAGESNVRVRFRQFEPSDDWWFALDNVLIDSKPAPRGARTVLATEDFGGDIPNEWGIDSGAGIALWRAVDSCSVSLLNANGGIFPDAFDGRGLHHFDDKFAQVSLDESCITPASVETLTTPVLDCSGTTAVVLHFKSALNVTDAVAEVLLSIDGGKTFDTAAPVFSYHQGGSLLRDPGNSETIYNEHDLLVPGAVDQKQVAFAFRYSNLAARTSFWAIDDVAVTADGGGVVVAQFHRGDSDNNAQLQLTDAIRILGFLFLGQIPPSCLDAADADDNGQLQLTDAVRILGFLFLGATPPAPPGPPDEPCGGDVNLEDPDLGCVEYTSC